MSLLPPEATFAEVVQEAFLRLRGKGLMLGALDAELLSAWADTGVPSDVVIAGLERAATRTRWDARPGELGPAEPPRLPPGGGGGNFFLARARPRRRRAGK